MCGRFAQFSSRDDYFVSLGLEGNAITFDLEPIGRYNVAPGPRVLLLHFEDNAYSLDPVYWGYDPEWWQKPPLIKGAAWKNGKYPMLTLFFVQTAVC